LADAVRRFDAGIFDPATIRAHAQQFDTNVFKSKLLAFIQDQMRDRWNYESTGK
jgi:hypothetical protein